MLGAKAPLVLYCAGNFLHLISYTVFCVTQEFFKEARLSGENYKGPPREATELMHQAQSVSLVSCKLSEISPSVLSKKSYDVMMVTAQKVPNTTMSCTGTCKYNEKH